MPSSSNPETKHKVTHYRDKGWQCSCKGWIFKHRKAGTDCHHIELVKGGEGTKIEELTEEQRINILLHRYALRGFRYIERMHEPMYSWDRRHLEHIKMDHRYQEVISVKAFGDLRVILAREAEWVYQAELDNFSRELTSYNFRKKKGREELKKTLRDKWFNIVQHILYNGTGVINPNLPDGSVYCKGKYGLQIAAIQKRYPFLKA